MVAVTLDQATDAFYRQGGSVGWLLTIQTSEGEDLDAIGRIYCAGLIREPGEDDDAFTLRLLAAFHGGESDD